MMIDGFDISVVVEHGYVHYKVVDSTTGKEIHCDMNELRETINEFQMENILH